MSDPAEQSFVVFDSEHEPSDAPIGAAPSATERPGFEAPPVFIPLDYVSVEMVLPSTNPTLVLREQDGARRELHIPIGVAEGVAIAYAARHVATPRPLTHELFTDVLEAYNLSLETVRITAVERTSYAAELVLSGAAGMRVLPCRVSDGVCLALRQRLAVPVTAAEAVLDQVAFDSTER